MSQLSQFDISNLKYIEKQYFEFLQSPESIEPSLRLFFEGINFAKHMSSDNMSSKEIHADDLIHHYRNYGHLKANLDPLGFMLKETKSFELNQFSLKPSDLKVKFKVAESINQTEKTLEEIIIQLEKWHCGHLSLEVSSCEPSVRSWFLNQVESEVPGLEIDASKKKAILHSLIRTEALEKFLHTRFVGAKRFSIEGGDALMPMLEHSVNWGSKLNVEDIVIGMAHRGRVNVLAHFMGRCLELVFSTFEGNISKAEGYDGDVKYHIGYSSEKQTPHGKCNISLAFNPSHLEFVNPVVCGMTRAKQRQKLDTEKRSKVLPILIHGDAAFIGQGISSETLQLSKLKGYTNGGSVHIIINNQIGFTTLPKDGRSTRYSSNLAHSIKAPVILVNGDDPEACVKAIHMAIEFRQTFHEDVVIDMFCYRRYGHNEGDEPTFTQPQMYQKIKNHPPLRKIYTKKLIEEEIVTEEQAQQEFQKRTDEFQETLERARKNPPENTIQAFGKLWKGFKPGTPEDFQKPIDTTFPKEQLLKLGQTFTTEPSNFNLNKKITKLLEQRKNMLANNKLDWGLTELLAYASLREDGYSVRLSGQDSKRGTFSHRHAVYFDTETNEEFCPLTQINTKKGEFSIYNSPLSEMAVLAFEYGNSISDPTLLTLWEAQFGDFANGAQVIIDQFLSSGEQKWARYTGLTLLLPHGYEGQGPEHSSARLERFLQLCAQHNMIVCNLSTPANLFHALRRQMKRDFRRPLIIMSPKSLLRHPKVVSSFEDLCENSFLEVIGDLQVTKPQDVETLILCSGKIYYDLEAKKSKSKNNNKISLVRIEQFYPFPKISLAPYLSGHPNLKKIIWTQEEPKNMGAYSFIKLKIKNLLIELGLKHIEIKYVGRGHKASPATGLLQTHQQEQNKIIEECFS